MERQQRQQHEDDYLLGDDEVVGKAKEDYMGGLGDSFADDLLVMMDLFGGGRGQRSTGTITRPATATSAISAVSGDGRSGKGSGRASTMTGGTTMGMDDGDEVRYRPPYHHLNRDRVVHHRMGQSLPRPQLRSDCEGVDE